MRAEHKDLLGEEPAVSRSLDDAEGDAEEPERGEDDTEIVELWSFDFVADLLDEERADKENERDEDIDPESPAPAEVGREVAAKDRTDSRSRACDAAPDAECHCTVAAFIGRDEKRRGRREHQCRADSLDDRLAPDQHADRVGIRCDERADCEDHRAEHEHFPAAIEIPEPSAGDREGREHQSISRDNPLYVLDIGAEIADDRRERDIEKRRVDDDDSERERKHGERGPFPES